MEPIWRLCGFSLLIHIMLAASQEVQFWRMLWIKARHSFFWRWRVGLCSKGGDSDEITSTAQFNTDFNKVVIWRLMVQKGDCLLIFWHYETAVFTRVPHNPIFL
jgi:hypothetical protein